MPGRKKQAPMGAPDWMVTYGDMMTLLLCFFVIMLSMSEMKQDKKFQEVMESIRSAFGYDASLGKVPLDLQTKNTLVEQMRKLVLPDKVDKEGDSDQEGIDGRVFRVTNVREGVSIVIGGRISFDRFRAELKPEAAELIAKAAGTMRGHNTMINVRGHATREPLPVDSRYADAMTLSIARAQAVADALERNGVRPNRIRIIGTGAHEPLVTQAYTDEQRAVNRRVEIIVTEAVVDDFAGRPATRETE